ncbi:hypothetical protein QUF72_09205 [Desulfobacterales bacterium HSG2]|nr:hypothetical protein [Desulfobacterales bacterium HSG2]
MSENNRFEEELRTYTCLKKICENARERSLNPADKYAQKVLIPLSEKKAGERRKEVARYFDTLHSKTDALFFLDMVARFEQIVFDKIDNASGQIRRIVKELYAKPDPFSKIAASFVKNQDDIHSLRNVHNLLENHIPKYLSEQLAAIIEHRNFIAHGGRIGRPSPHSVEEIALILDEILDHI